MGLVKKGATQFGLIPQPGAELVFERDGSVRGRRVLEGDVAHWERDAFVIGSLFPDFPSVECFTSQVTFLGSEKVRVTLDYIGLDSDPTPYQIEFVGNTGQDPIEAHPNFQDFAGTWDEPETGAMFDLVLDAEGVATGGSFVGFGPEAGDDLAGVTDYLTPSVTIRRTYWTYQTPRPVALGSIAGTFGDIILPPGTGNFLSSGFSYRKLGRAYQVTEEYMGSGRKNWSNRIYN